MTTHDVDAGSLPGLSRAAGRIGFAGGLSALLLLAALHVLRPDLDPSSHVISEYAVGAYGWVMALCFASLAVGCAGVIAVLWRSASSVLGRIGLMFMVAAAIGLTMAAFFPMDPIETARESPSLSGQMHGVAAMIGNPGFMIGAVLITLALRKVPDWARVHTPIVVATILIWIAFALMMNALMGMAQEGSAEAGGIGWPNRLLWAAYCAWVMFAAWPTVRKS